MKAVVIGVGNEFRCDDGIGPRLAAAVERLGRQGLSVQISDGEPTQLLDAWSGADLAVVVDAVLCEPSDPGRIHRTSLDQLRGQLAQRSLATSHGIGIPEALGLGLVLGRAPRRMVVYAVEAQNLGFGVGLSPAVAATLPELTRRVVDELDRSQ